MQILYTANPENSVKDGDGMLRSSDCDRGMELEELLKHMTFTRQVLDNLTNHLSTISMVLTSICCELFKYSMFCKLRIEYVGTSQDHLGRMIKYVSANML